MSRFQILSLIGGGIRGSFITSYLKELEQQLGRPIAESFDLIAGTSTGGIIAAGLAHGYSTEEMHDFYVRYGASIFHTRPPYKPSGRYRLLFSIANSITKLKNQNRLDTVFRSRYCPGGLAESFDKGFGELTLGDIKCSRLILPTFNLTKGEPHIFRSSHLPLAVRDKDVRIADALLATTAAPTYFPHHKIEDSSYIDGGVWAADPSMLAVAEAIRIQQFQNQLDPDADITTNNIHLLSIGTGHSQFSLTPPEDDPGILYWANKIAEVMSTAQSQGVHLPLKFFLGDRYEHVNFKMEEYWPLDEVSNMEELFTVGEQRAKETFQSIKDKFLDHERPCFVPFLSNKNEIVVQDLGI